MSQLPETEELASVDGELSGDDAVLAHLMKEPEQGAAEGSEAEEAPEQEEVAEEAAENEAEEVEEDDDPEIDLGEIKLRKSELKAGYMKDADYRRKTAEAAEAKREAQVIAERVQQERSHYANQLDVFLQNLHTELVGDQAALAKLAVEDPAEWVAQNAAFQQRAAKFQQALTERQALAERQSADEQRQHQEWATKERDALRKKLPSWDNPEVFKKESQEIASYLLEVGYPQEELVNLQDHRALLIARDAAKWQAHQKAVISAKAKQTKPEPGKPLKPGAAQQSQSDQKQADLAKLRDRARRTQSSDDIANYLIAKQG